MNFQSILYRLIAPGRQTEQAEAPEFLKDLNLDQIVAAVTAGRDEYDLQPFFHRPLDDPDEIVYRQEVMRDLESPSLFAPIAAFADRMRHMRSHLRAAEERYYRLNKQGWLLDAVAIYCAAVRQLTADLAEIEPQSQGLRNFRDYLSDYAAAQSFRTLVADTERVKAALNSVKYCIQIRDSSVTVRNYEDEADYSLEIERTFAKFRQGDVKDYRTKFPEFSGMNHVEAQILEFVARLYPEIFADFDKYCRKHEEFIEATLRRFDREIQFYIAYLQYVGKLRHAGLAFCYPKVTRQTKEVHAGETFDLALADKLTSENATVVVNDFHLRGAERVLVVSGPNSGGKTTFARTFGQLHYLARLGCPVPGTSAQLFLYDHIFTHFEREETIENLQGKLQNDLLRVHRILAEATPDSLVVMNEIFSSTALADAVFLATRVMERILALGCLCVCVTFLDELAAMSEAVVSMVSTVVPENPALRTFKLIRRPADGRAYAMAIAEKYRLTYRFVKERLAS
ncbi:MAG TPA: DNA mismatch repair protein MutS [Stellaceae bacterium]|nr:DNA mismatch repair protein MutS [Stellaceae bacterium]